MKPVARRALAAHHAGFRHTERVPHRGAPRGRDLGPLGVRQRLGRAQDLFDRPVRQIDAALLGQIGEVQAVGAHAQPDGGPQALDQLDLQL